MPESSTSKKQSILSSYFSQPSGSSTHTSSSHRLATAGQRSSSPIDLTNSLDEERPSKRRKVSDRPADTGKSQLERNTPRLASKNSTIVQYRFGSQVSSQTLSAEAENARLRRHERAKRLLLSDHNVLDRQGSKEQGEHDASDPEEEEEQRRSTSPVKVTSQGAALEAGGDKFEETMAFFANSSAKNKGGRKKAATTAAPARVTKKVQEIGPSGEPYTPLELQVSTLMRFCHACTNFLQVKNFKEQNSGTFLMFEIGYKIIFYGDDAQVSLMFRRRTLGRIFTLLSRLLRGS